MCLFKPKRANIPDPAPPPPEPEETAKDLEDANKKTNTDRKRTGRSSLRVERKPTATNVSSAGSGVKV